MKILYHTSNTIITTPDTLHSREHLDFGRGFYLTPLYDQASKYAERFLRKGEDAYINVYEIEDELTEFSLKVFDAYDNEWLDFVTACRKGLPHPAYDVIEGGIADDQVFNTIDLYFAEIYTYEQALDQLRFKRPNRQLCITNQKILAEKLHFVKYIKI